MPRLKENLTENALDFWFPRSVDGDHGGFYFYGGFDEPASFRVKACGYRPSA